MPGSYSGGGMGYGGWMDNLRRAAGSGMGQHPFWQGVYGQRTDMQGPTFNNGIWGRQVQNQMPQTQVQTQAPMQQQPPMQMPPQTQMQGGSVMAGSGGGGAYAGGGNSAGGMMPFRPWNGSGSGTY